MTAIRKGGMTHFESHHPKFIDKKISECILSNTLLKNLILRCKLIMSYNRFMK